MLESSTDDSVVSISLFKPIRYKMLVAEIAKLASSNFNRLAEIYANHRFEKEASPRRHEAIGLWRGNGSVHAEITLPPVLDWTFL
jgi:hypothetical protein